MLTVRRSRSIREADERAAEARIVDQRLREIQSSLVSRNSTVRGALNSVSSQVSTPFHINGPASSQQAQASINVYSCRVTLPRKAKQRFVRRWRGRICLPRWICKSVWELSMYQTDGLRRFDLRSIKCHEDDSPIFDYVRTGNVAVVKKLLDAGILSPYELRNNGSLLEVGRLSNACCW